LFLDLPGLAVLLDNGDAGHISTAALVQILELNSNEGLFNNQSQIDFIDNPFDIKQFNLDILAEFK
jgi:hypothetical protein